MIGSDELTSTRPGDIRNPSMRVTRQCYYKWLFKYYTAGSKIWILFSTAKVQYFTNKHNDWVEYYFYYNKLKFFKLPWIFFFIRIDKKKSLVQSKVDFSFIAPVCTKARLQKVL